MSLLFLEEPNEPLLELMMESSFNCLLKNHAMAELLLCYSKWQYIVLIGQGN